MNIGMQEVMFSVGLIGGALGIATYFKKQYKSVDLAEFEKSQNEKLEIVKNRLRELEIKISPVLTVLDVIQQEAFKGLKSNPDPSHAERDRLIDKYLDGRRLSREEARTLAQGFMGINEGLEAGNKGLAVLGLAVLASKYASEIEDLLRPAQT